MLWLPPAIIATMIGTAILAFCYFYLFLQDNKPYLRIWAVSWAIYFTRYIFMLAFVLWQKHPYFLIGNQLASLTSGILLLYGSYLFMEKKFPSAFLYIAVINALWIITSILTHISFKVMALPTFSFLALIYIWTGYIFIKHSKKEQKEASIVGGAFIIWGIHKANYPFLRPVLWFAPWGYILAAMLEFITALGLLLVYFRKTKNELINNQNSLLEAQRTAKMGDWSWTPETNELTWSDQTYRIFGYNPGSFKTTTETLNNAIHPDDYKRFIETQKTALIEGRDGEIEYRITLPDGDIRYVHSIFSILKKDTGTFTKITGTVQDITEKKKADEQIKVSEKWYRSILNEAPMLFVIHQEGIIRFINEYGCKLLGQNAPGDLINRSIFDFVAPEFKQIARHRTPNKAFGEANPAADIKIVLPNNDSLFVQAVSVPSSFNGVPAALVMAIDITDRKHFEIEVNKQKRLFETMFNTIPDGVVITNTKREIQLANTGMKTTFGYKPEELTGKDTRMLYATRQTYMETGQVVFDETTQSRDNLYITRYKDKQGREFSGETFGAKLFDESDQWIGNLGIMRDITEREQAEIRIQQAQKMESVGTLAGGIAHDFNNILFPIIGMSELLLEDCPPDSPEYEFAREIYQAGKRGSALVKQILAFSRQSEHKLVPVRVQKILTEVLKLTRATIPTNIEITRNIQQDCGLVAADPTQIHQIAMNLITNAYHAVEFQNGKIDIQLRQAVLQSDQLPEGMKHTNRVVILTVTDNGPGIAPETLPKIFEPYFTTKKQGKGTGLGLSVVYGIVRAQNGDIKVYSEKGKGTTFTIYLPLMMNPVDSTLDEIKADDPGGSEKILVVDDEIPIIRLEEKILGRLGYTVTSHANSLEALERFKKAPDAFDLVITDMAMPSMTGEQFVKAIKNIRPDIPIIICTGFSERINKDRAETLGINGFLMKPIIKSEMARTIRTALDQVKIQTN